MERTIAYIRSSDRDDGKLKESPFKDGTGGEF